MFCKNKTFSAVTDQAKTVYCHSFAITLGIGKNSSFSQLQTLKHVTFTALSTTKNTFFTKHFITSGIPEKRDPGPSEDGSS